MTDGTFPGSEISFPADVVVDSSGNLYIVDTDNSRVRKVTALTLTGIITTIAGNGTAGCAETW